MIKIREIACIPSSSWEQLRELYGMKKLDYYKLLDEGYIQAKKNTTLICKPGREMYYLLNETDIEGKRVGVRFIPNPRREQNPDWPWYLVQAEQAKTLLMPLQDDEELMETEPNEVLKKFAWLGSEPDFYQALYEIMMKEEWYFPKDELNISLASYIKYTFYRIQIENKISYSINNDYAAFNTGLVDGRDNDIYCLFEACGEERHQNWIFKTFCIRGTGSGKILGDKFTNFPERANYTLDERLRDIKLGVEIDVDYHHIIISNAARLPEEMIISAAYKDATDQKKRSNPLIKNLLDQRNRLLKNNSDKDKTGKSNIALLNQRISTLVAENSELQGRLLDRLEEHVKIARNRVDQNPAIAVPIYYPGKNIISVVLPLYMKREDTVAYGALLIGLTEAGNYQAHTVLTPCMAYIDARIIRPIDSLWLEMAYQNERNKMRKKLKSR